MDGNPTFANLQVPPPQGGNSPPLLFARPRPILKNSAPKGNSAAAAQNLSSCCIPTAVGWAKMMGGRK